MNRIWATVLMLLQSTFRARPEAKRQTKAGNERSRLPAEQAAIDELASQYREDRTKQAKEDKAELEKYLSTEWKKKREEYSSHFSPL